MASFPCATSPLEAIGLDLPVFRTVSDASRVSGRPVFFAAGPLPETFPTLDALDDQFGPLFASGRAFRQPVAQGWVVGVRFWRPA